MHIIHLSSELAPIAKVGGLGDVVYGLSKELVRQGHTVEIILPKYDCIHYELLQKFKVHYRELWSYDGPYRYNNTVWSAEVEGLSILLIDPHHPSYLFHRGAIYGCSDDIERFLYFSRAAMEFLFKSQRRPDILHLHDWPTSIASILLKDMYLALGTPPIKTVLTLHNLEHQGKCLPKHLTQIGLQGERYLSADLLQDPHQLSLINLLKGGIEYASILTTVSPSYEKEIKTPLGGYGLENTLIKHAKKLYGILNGIDEDFWNPEKDPFLPHPFSTHPPFIQEKMQHIQMAKRNNKKALQQKLALNQDSAVPLVACISRLVPQKSPALIAYTFEYVLSQGGQCVILGSAFDAETFELFSTLSSAYASSTQGALILDYDEPLSHLIYAASDLFVVPSLFEPCGLTQLIALRYGSIPLVRKTGGLKDTIFHKKNGFLFKQLTKEDLARVIDQALLLWKEHPQTWADLQQHGMEMDYSWKRAAQEYVCLYSKDFPFTR